MASLMEFSGLIIPSRRTSPRTKIKRSKFITLSSYIWRTKMARPQRAFRLHLTRCKWPNLKNYQLV
jgi:hypothetical protein